MSSSAAQPHQNNCAVRLAKFGSPKDVAELVSIPVPSPSPGEALVQMEYSPINPADLNVLEGRYGQLPALPCVPGHEGVGRVLALGGDSTDGATGRLLGRRVLLPAGFGAWRTLGVASISELLVVPEAVPVQQAAMLRINPATAFCMLRNFVKLRSGDWLVQNAANSGVGRSVIQIARALGLRTVNIVRRPGLEAELRAIGADVVLEEGSGLAQRIAGAMDGAAPRLALNAVGGDCALALAKALAPSGTLVTYGAMARQPLTLPNGLLIFKDLILRGFWISQWYRLASTADISTLFSQLLEWAAAGVLHTPIEAVYPLREVSLALAHAQKGERDGKILLGP
jgi:mitochondrial enoyl-[acyl-carrier protein] reductase / trans-2-enoyl-CoA reductase